MSENELEIREAGPGDTEQVTQFSLACARDSENLELDRDTVRAGVENALKDPAKARYFLAEKDGTPVGQIMLTREWSDWRNTWIWWLQSVYVDPDARGSGVFAAIYAHIEKLAREAGAAAIRLYVDKGNTAAERAYLKAGFAMDHYNQMARNLAR